MTNSFPSRRNFIKRISLLTGAALLTPNLLKSQTKQKSSTTSFIDQLKPAIKKGGFEMKDYWIWGSSIIKGEDGLYHMFADRWPKELGFNSWITASEVVHAIAKNPQGPYEFVNIALPKRKSSFFDGLVTHNPRIIKYKNTYYLYYFGTTYNFPTPSANEAWQDDYFEKAWMNKRIGIAWSKNINGPWNRLDKPILEPRPQKWDATITTNPSPVIDPLTKRILMVYKSSSFSSAPPLMLGITEAKKPLGKYKRLTDEPIFRFDNHTKDNDVEDPFVWHNGEYFELIMKDRFGHICGEDGAGLHATSQDAIQWHLSNPVKAYSRTVQWNDGTQTIQANLERPFLLIEEGKPTHLFLATGEGESPWNFKRTWNMVIPLI
ncbi:MAG: hypothetical protein GX367_05795 [Bacteroidales bacterium]|nr:hypothetical protein [Bacteroidales bacterium]